MVEELGAFDYVSPTEESVEKIKEFRTKCLELSLIIKGMTPGSREKSLALTKLEETAMWGNKAIVFNQ